jgi:NADH:ubiquinone oxidoreductase subunit F (NADH-binding)
MFQELRPRSIPPARIGYASVESFKGDVRRVVEEVKNQDFCGRWCFSAGMKWSFIDKKIRKTTSFSL